MWAAFLASCSNEQIEIPAQTKLQVGVTTPAPFTKAPILSGVFQPNSEIGVTLVDTSNDKYDGAAYKNVRFTETSGKWVPDTDIELTNKVGTAYACYPYQSGQADITALPIDISTQTDYMYAEPVTNVSIQSPTANFEMKHALSVLHLIFKRGSYTGTGAVTELKVKGNCAATNATLNAKTGELTNKSGGGTALSFNDTFTLPSLTTEKHDCYLIVVPSGTSSTLDISFKLDGTTYACTAPANTLATNHMYNYNVIVNGTLSTVSVGNVYSWSQNPADQEDVTISGSTR